MACMRACVCVFCGVGAGFTHAMLLPLAQLHGSDPRCINHTRTRLGGCCWQHRQHSLWRIQGYTLRLRIGCVWVGVWVRWSRRLVFCHIAPKGCAQLATCSNAYVRTCVRVLAIRSASCVCQLQIQLVFPATGDTTRKQHSYCVYLHTQPTCVCLSASVPAAIHACVVCRPHLLQTCSVMHCVLAHSRTCWPHLPERVWPNPLVGVLVMSGFMCADCRTPGAECYRTQGSVRTYSYTQGHCATLWCHAATRCVALLLRAANLCGGSTAS